MTNKKILVPVKLSSIQKKVMRYYKKMNAIGEVTKNESKEIRFDKEHHFLQFYLSKDSFKKLIKISELDGFDGFVAFFGLEGPARFNKPTVCILGADAQKEILNQHKEPFINAKGEIQSAVMGDEHNPPPPYGKDGSKKIPKNCFRLTSSPDDIADYFNRINPPLQKKIKK